jgi:TolA-binding protein
MKNPLPIIAIVGFVVLLFAVRGRRKRHKPTRLERLRESVDAALDDAEVRTRELRTRAKKMRGEAKKRIEEQAHDVEERQKELRGRLDELKAEAGKLLERAKA